MKKVIGIDLGTTSISAVVLDRETEEGLESRTIAGGHFLETGETFAREQDAAEILEKAYGLLEELLLRHPETEQIGIDCQMHGIVYLDGNGRCVSPLYTWQDGRGNEDAGAGKSLVEEIREETGLPVSTGYGLVTHIYNQRMHLVPERAVTFGTIGDALALFLTGEKKPLVHVTNAAGFGFFDVEHGCFQKEALVSYGVSGDFLPEVTSETAVVGTFQGRKVTVAYGDNQASFYGAAGRSEGTILVNIGTGSQVSLLTSSYAAIPGIDVRPFGTDQYLMVGVSLCGGKAYAMLEHFFRSYVEMACGSPQKPQYDVMEKLAREACKERTLYKDKVQVDTRFCGTREDAAIRGSITGIGEENFIPGEWILATMEGMVQILYEQALAMERTGARTERLVVSGNGIRRNPILRELTETMFGMDAQMCLYEEEAARGAALFAKEA